MQPVSNATTRKPMWRHAYNWTAGLVILGLICAFVWYVFFPPVESPKYDLGQALATTTTPAPTFEQTLDRVTRQCSSNNAAATASVTSLKPCLTGATRGTIKHGAFVGTSNVYGRVGNVMVAAQPTVSDVKFNAPQGSVVVAVVGRVGTPNESWSDWRLISKGTGFTANTGGYLYDVVVLYAADASSMVVPSTVADDIATTAGFGWPTMMTLLYQS